MPKAFDRLDDIVPTVKCIGEVREITEGYFSAVLLDDYVHGEVKAVIEVPFSSVAETERVRALPGMMFYCDVELDENEAPRNIRTIEFDDELTDAQQKAAAAFMLELLAKDEERWGS